MGIIGKIYTFLLVALSWCSVYAAAPAVEAAPAYELSAEIEAIIQKYQDPAFIEQATQAAARFEDPDFIHRMVHPREAAFERIDAFNKKVLYEFPFFIRTHEKGIGICGCDVIGLASHFIQKFLDKRAMASTLRDIAAALAQATVANTENLIQLLSAEKGREAADHLMQAAWQTTYTRQPLYNYLKHRLPTAALQYVKKKVTPPPFFLHGKTKEGKETDYEASHIAPITSVIPLSMLTGDRDLGFKDTQVEYVLEGAKQLELIGTIDESLVFIMAKEVGISLLFFHRDFKKQLQELLQIQLIMQGKNLLEQLQRYAALQKEINLAADTKAAAEKEITTTLQTYFSLSLQRHLDLVVRTQHSAQNFYTVGLTAALLAPVAYKIARFGWKFLRTVTADKATNGATQ